MSLRDFLLVVVYIRVSTDGQNIAMQLAAAEQFLKGIPDEQRLILIDDGVSALKVKMRDRRRLNELLELIRAGKVGTLIVYDRDRLARNFYEYLEIVRLLHEKQVNVIFTATNVRPFDSSLVVEAIGAMFAQLEGQTIVRRRADAQKQFPSSLIGYKRDKGESGKVIYTPDERADTISELFYSIVSSVTTQDFLATLQQFKRKLNRNELRLLQMLRTPFYAGCWEQAGQLKQLDHVKAIVPIALYEEVQSRLAEFKSLTDRIVAPDAEQAFVQPYCGLCGNPMKYRNGHIETESTYSCSTGHRRNSVSAPQLLKATKQVMEQKIASLDVEAVVLECGAWLKGRQSSVNKQIVALEAELSRSALMIVNNYGAAESEELVQRTLVHLKTVEKGMLERRMQRESFDILTAQLHLLGELVTRYLCSELTKPEDMRTLAQFLIRRLEVYPDRLQIAVNFSRFFHRGGEQRDAS